MGLTIPKLAWAQHRKTLVYLADSADLLVAIKDFITSDSTYWEVNAWDSAGECQWVELKPKAGSAIPNQRIVLAQKSVIGAPNNILSPHSAVSNEVYWCLAPSVTGSAALDPDPLGAAAGAVYAGGTAFQNRCTGWVKTLPIPAGAYYWLFLQETSEWLGLGVVYPATSLYVYCNWIGAWLAAPDDQDGDPGPAGAYDAGRIYGITGSGGWDIVNTIWTTGNADSYMQFGGGGVSSWVAFAMAPESPLTTKKIVLGRQASGMLYGPFADVNEQRTYLSCHQGMPASYFYDQAGWPYLYLGKARQMYLGAFGRFLFDEGLEAASHKVFINSGSPLAVYQSVILTDD